MKRSVLFTKAQVEQLRKAYRGIESIPVNLAPNFIATIRAFCELLTDAEVEYNCKMVDGIPFVQEIFKNILFERKNPNASMEDKVNNIAKRLSGKNQKLTKSA